MMINGIRRIKNFGIFSDFRHLINLQDFSKKNIIYGWNYTGKTTISRIFSCLEHKKVPPNYIHSEFNINYLDSTSISESNLHLFLGKVKVFNADFIANNLEWDGKSFDPIFLLGDESIEAQEKIRSNEKSIDKCNQGIQKKEKKINDINDHIRDEKTKIAKFIKEELSLVSAFTAAHINQIIPQIDKSHETYILKSEPRKALLKKALANDADKLSPVKRYNGLSGNIKKSLFGVSDLLSKTPEMTNTIDYLAKNHSLAQWIKEGIEHHKDKNICEFCGNEIERKRINKIESHFSKDLENHESKINNTIEVLEKNKIVFTPNHERDYYQIHRDEVNLFNAKMIGLAQEHNKQIDTIINSLNEKLRSQFTIVTLPIIDSSIDERINSASDKLNKIANSNDAITKNFDKEKSNAIEKLKYHYTSEFIKDIKLNRLEIIKNILDKHIKHYKKISKYLFDENLHLESTISKAQKGREELNRYISKFLNHSNIEIEVLKTDNKERFRLMRGSKIAHNLSEGEKTAIAFSFFLVKLQEESELSDLIIYIDDPISSLDSNHLFQVNAVIKDFFFTQDANNPKNWTLNVKQIFFSTHNFEFLSLLKELPLSDTNNTKYFLVKRLSDNQSTLLNLPESIKKYSSEYHYLWDVIYSFHTSNNKGDLELLLALPNAVRRFIELYTYSKIPSTSYMSVDRRADLLFGQEKSKRILKVLHYFSHLNNINRMAQNSDLLSDIENVVTDIIEYVKADTLHYNALMDAL